MVWYITSFGGHPRGLRTKAETRASVEDVPNTTKEYFPCTFSLSLAGCLLFPLNPGRYLSTDSTPRSAQYTCPWPATRRNISSPRPPPPKTQTRVGRRGAVDPAPPLLRTGQVQGGVHAGGGPRGGRPRARHAGGYRDRDARATRGERGEPFFFFFVTLSSGPSGLCVFVFFVLFEKGRYRWEEDAYPLDSRWDGGCVLLSSCCSSRVPLGGGYIAIG